MKKIYNIICIACIIFATSSCSDFLNEANQTQISEEQVLTDIKLADLNMQSIYDAFKENYKDERCWYLLQGTDEIQTGALQSKDANASAWDFCDGAMNSENSYVTSAWNYRWPVIANAAKIVRAIKAMNPQPGSAEEQLMGEAAFIRGFLTYQSTMIWGRVPIIDLQRIDDGELSYARQPLKDVWQFIIDDFTLATKAPKHNSEGRATSYAGWTMLGKAYMSAPEETGLRDFNKAKECFEKVMDGTYTLLPDYNDLWDYTKSATSEVIFTNTFSCARGYANQVQFQLGSRAAQNWFGDGCSFAGYDHSVPTVHAYETVENGGVWEEGDARKEASLRYDFSYNGVEPDLSSLTWEGLSEEDHDELKPHIKKYEDFRTDVASGLEVNNMWLSGKNIPVLRYADVLLCYAECLNELGQTAKAETYVNQVRDRAFGGSQPSDLRWSGLSQTEFREKMQDERIRELFGENWRRYDLIRTGQFLPRLKKYNKWAAQSVAAGKFKDHLQLFPIPLTELNQNLDMRIDGKFDQNEGY